MFVCCKCCVLSGSGLCDGPITRPGESYRLWHVIAYDLETMMRRPWSALGCCAREKKERERHIRMIITKKNVKFCLAQAMKAQRGSKGIALLFL